MRPFDYQRATSLDAAAKLAANGQNARFIAGGTNLLDLMKLEIEHPETLIDISRLPLDEIAPTDDGGLRIGGQRVGHGLDGDGCVAAHRHTPHMNLP